MVEQLNETVLNIIEIAALAVETLAVVIIVVSVVWGLITYVIHSREKPERVETRFSRYKKTLGRALLLGLEILVAADIIKTVALDTTIQSVAVLGLLVIIRIFLSWSIIVEIEGRWPWQPQRKGDDEEESDEAANG